MFTHSESFLEGYKHFKLYSDIGATPITQFICTEWKLLDEIHHLLQKIILKNQFTIIKSYQDNNIENARLDLSAQLNVDADRLVDDKTIRTLSNLL